VVLGWQSPFQSELYAYTVLHRDRRRPPSSTVAVSADMIRSSLPRQLIGLMGWLLVSFSAGAIGAIASVDARNFYGQLIRPDWAPPGWLFAPVWSTLYAMMGFSAWLVWRRNGFKPDKTPLVLFVVQLAVNALWSWLFFAWHQGGLAFAEVLVLWVLIVATCIAFWRSHAPAGVLMLPYLAWVTFASFLTYATWQLNPDLL
jgi:benzodiazapine receptor